jgi:hypothetical protein
VFDVTAMQPRQGRAQVAVGMLLRAVGPEDSGQVGAIARAVNRQERKQALPVGANIHRGAPGAKSPSPEQGKLPGQEGRVVARSQYLGDFVHSSPHPMAGGHRPESY